MGDFKPLKQSAKVVCIVLLIFMQTSCIFGPNRFRGVMSYRNDKVYLFHDRYYRVGQLPAGWERMKTKVRAIAFHHKDYRSTLFTDAFCYDSFDDAPNHELISQMVGGLEQLKLIQEDSFVLNNRGALKKMHSATLDGVPITITSVVIKKNRCLFDFVAIAPRQSDAKAEEDFVTFYEGFNF